jgi:spore coat protein E
MSSYKEIVTKAVVGKGKKYFTNTYEIEATNKPSTVLGCWVINHKFKGTEGNNPMTFFKSLEIYS